MSEKREFKTEIIKDRAKMPLISIPEFILTDIFNRLILSIA